MNNHFDPRTKEEKDRSEEMMLAEALYIYERNLEGEDFEVEE
ncbi:MAG TPA: hypothetical protein VJZ48_01245 [Bacilli bacterium]|nr:hypothetical protein [Bacilli bacterium]